MSLITIPNTFTVGAVIVASQHNANFSTIYSDYNGNITDANISASAGITDTKLGQITTAGKVSGAALTTLSSTPAGAGVIPVANLGTGASSTSFLRGDGTFTTSLFGTVVTGQVISTVYQATTDGLVLVTITPNGGGDICEFRNDTSNPPTTVKGYYGNPTGGASTRTLTIPVKASSYYRVVQTSGSLATASMEFWPL